MRDTARIKPMCDQIAEIWEQLPDWRFSQLMCNFVRQIGYDPFYLEDDKFIELLREYVNKV